MIGYDKLSLNHQLLLGLTFEEMTGLITHDRAKPYHPMTLTGTPPTWHSLASGLPYIAFDGAADYLQCPGALSADLNFVADDFTLLVWVCAAPVGADVIISQGEVDVSGWELFVYAANIAFRTSQVGGHTEIDAVGAFTPSEWLLIGVTRHGASGQFYVQGQPVDTLLNGGLTNPVSPAGGERLLVGVHKVGGVLSNFWKGDIAGGPCGPRIWERQLSAEEMLQIFNLEKHWFGV